MFEFKGTFPQSFDPWDTSSYIWNQILENKCVDFLPNYIWVKFIKITAWKATEGQDLQISSKKSTKMRKVEQNDLYNFEGKFREISQNPENLNFLQKIENLKVLQAEFQANLSNFAF